MSRDNDDHAKSFSGEESHRDWAGINIAVMNLMQIANSILFRELVGIKIDPYPDGKSLLRGAILIYDRGAGLCE